MFLTHGLLDKMPLVFRCVHIEGMKRLNKLAGKFEMP